MWMQKSYFTVAVGRGLFGASFSVGEAAAAGAGSCSAEGASEVVEEVVVEAKVGAQSLGTSARTVL